MTVQVERFQHGTRESVTTSTKAGAYFSLADEKDDDEAMFAIGLDFGPDDEPLWVVDGNVKRESGSRVVLSFAFTEPVGDKFRSRRVVIDFDNTRMDSDGESVAYPRVTVE